MEQQTAAKEAAAAARLVKVQAAKVLRLEKRARVAAVRQQQLAVLGAREREIKVRRSTLFGSCRDSKESTAVNPII